MLMFFCIVVRKTYAVRKKGESMMITKRFERELEKLGAFEISFDMLKLSEKNEKHFVIFECRKRKS